MKFTTKKLVTLALLAALAYIVTFVFNLLSIAPLPAAPYLKLDPKDVIIVIGGFFYGPFSVILMSLAVSLIEMFTVSTTGPIGLIMNIAATCAFAGTAALVYKYKKSFFGAIIGLAAGYVLTVAVMLPLNYLLTPLYTPMSREAVAGLLLPVILPFNLIKIGVNTALTIMLFAPVTAIFKKADLN